MFQKLHDVQQSAKSAMKNKDLRRLRQDIQSGFGAGEEAVDALVPAKSKTEVAKMPGRRQVYLSPPPDQDPLLVDLDGRRTFIPTVYGLWRAPDLLPALLVFAPATRRLLNGADVMLAGVRFPSEAKPLLEAVASGRSTAGAPFHLPVGAFVAVRAVGNPAPVAVAKLLLSTAQMAERLLLGSAGGAPQGKAAQIVHIYKDELWGKGTRGRPNDGFLPTGVAEVDEEAATLGGPGGLVVGVGGDADPEDAVGGPAESPADGPDAEEEGAAPAEAGAASAAGAAEEAGADSHGQGTRAESEEGEDEEEEEEDQDRLLIASLCQALRMGAAEREYPMEAGTFFSSQVLANRPAGTDIDLKRSSFGKLSKFLAAAQDEGLLEAASKQGKLLVMSVNEDHPLVAEHQPWSQNDTARARLLKEQRRAAAAASSEGATGSGEAVSRASHKTGPIVQVKWKPHGNLRPLVGGDSKRLWDMQELQQLLSRYVQEKELVDPENKAYVHLDETLVEGLVKGQMKKDASGAWPTRMSRKELADLFKGRVTAYHFVLPVDGGDPVVSKGSLPAITIHVEEHGGRKKSATVVAGMRFYGVEATDLAKRASKKFACSATTEGDGDAAVVVIQGNMQSRVPDLLRAEYNIGSKFVSIEAKRKAAVKKRGRGGKR